jgi:LysR family transcriptional activator of mexEF-oprN operon
MTVHPMANLGALDLNLLRVFDAVARERHVTRAAQRLRLPQPTVSNALGRLRQVMGDELFVRSPRGVEPTTLALSMAEPIAEALELIEQSLGKTPFDPATDARVFRIGWSDDVAILALPLLRRLWAAAPNCRLITRAANFRTIPAMLESGEIGTAVGFMSDDLPAATKQKVLRRSGFRVLRDAASPGPVDLDAYCARPHVLVTPRGDTVGFVDAALDRLGRSRRVVLGLPDFGLLHQVLLGTDLLCSVSDVLADALTNAVTKGGLASDPLPFPSRSESAMHMAWRAALDRDPGEIWLRMQIAEALARQR